jgi:hypothetical protein
VYSCATHTDRYGAGVPARAGRRRFRVRVCCRPNNRILGARTGLYCGNSDGCAPFIDGLIEHNLVLNPSGYWMEITWAVHCCAATCRTAARPR